MMNYKVIVAHPGQQHSFKVASALKKGGMLLQYITSVYDKEKNLAMKLAHKVVRGQDSLKILKRKNDDIEENEVSTFYTFLSLVVIVLSRNKHTRSLSNALDRWLADRIGIKVAKYAIKNKADAVICFSMNEQKCFEYLEKKAPKIKRIVDCANSPVDYMRYIYDQDIAMFNSIQLKGEVGEFWDATVLEKQMKGIQATQYFLAPSQFVKKGLQYCGVAAEKIHVVHYGSNFSIGNAQRVAPDKVRFIYVGQVTYRKGMHHLLKIFSSIPEVELDVVGAWKYDSELIRLYKDCTNIHFHGQVQHAEVQKLLQNANVFVFPSLTEGFSLSCVEALSCGLPIICTTNSGANDLIKDGINGFVVSPGDEDGMKEKIRFMIDNSSLIPVMSQAAIDTATNTTWEEYGKAVINSLNIIL